MPYPSTPIAGAVYRGPFRFRNSGESVRRFPFPFPDDQYRYSVNLEPHRQGAPGSVYEFDFDVDEHYENECAERAIVLDRDPYRCVVMPHMRTAEWDTLALLMTSMARDYPADFALDRRGRDWHWTNRRLGVDQRFRFGDDDDLPESPLRFIGRQAQGDFVLLDQREGNLWADAGLVTCQADWSIAFDAGMNFFEWHGPVPMAHRMGVFDRALKFLMNVRQGQPARRLNWTLTVRPRLDTAPETYDEWGPDRARVTPDNAGRLVHLRVELQTFWRLPVSNALLFPIRCYLCSIEDLAKDPERSRRLLGVLRTLPSPLIEYKGFAGYYPQLIEWLER
ncbi:MAG: DUF3445 domain-containing protein [Burkholderiaceae bacterium]